MEALKLLSQNMLEFSRGLGDILAQAWDVKGLGSAGDFEELRQNFSRKDG